MHWAYKISFKILSGWLIIVPEISGGQFLPHPVYIKNFQPLGKYHQKTLVGTFLPHPADQGMFTVRAWELK